MKIHVVAHDVGELCYCPAGTKVGLVGWIDNGVLNLGILCKICGAEQRAKTGDLSFELAKEEPLNVNVVEAKNAPTERVPQVFSREVTAYDRELMKKHGIAL